MATQADFDVLQSRVDDLEELVLQSISPQRGNKAYERVSDRVGANAAPAAPPEPPPEEEADDSDY